VLELREVDVPEPEPGQVRVAIYAAGTNPVDAGNRADGTWAGLQPPVIPGSDASGVVDAVGPDVTTVSPGDPVFYMSDFLGTQRGTYAEYQVVDAELVVPKPASLSHVEAAALPLAAGTAYEMIVRRLAVEPGEWVLLYGAAGGVGSLALQLAVANGASVIGVARAHHHERLQRLGAHACLDYTRVDVPRQAQLIAGRKLDVIVDCVGGETISRSLDAVRPFGRAASIVGLRGDLDRVLDLNVTLHGVLVRPDRARLEDIAALADAGQLRALVDQVLPLEQAVLAHHRLDTGHGHGKIVLQVRPEPS
jgi:NADPH2:quinone reductase